MEDFMEVRKVLSKSQLTLPKEFSGKLVSIDKIADGVLQIKIGRFVPDSERIFHSEDYQRRLERLDEWMDQRDPGESDLEELFKKNKR
jgi:hypothetical protein